MKKPLYFVAIMALMVACNGTNDTRENERNADTPTTGEIRIACDESFQLLINAEIDGFVDSYKKAKINALYVPEDKAIQLMLKDSVQVVFTTRPLNESELKVLEKQQIGHKIYKIAVDGVALISNLENPDSTLTVQQIKSIFGGKTKYWNEVSPKNAQKDISLVFDNANSSNFNYMKSSFEMTDISKIKIFGAKSNVAVIEYVQKNREALGIIGVNWISDPNDPKQLSFLKSIRVVGVVDTTKSKESFQPFQAYFSTKDYPLTRQLYAIVRGARPGLGVGFCSYITADKGQRIVLKAGLLPASMPIRLIETK